MEDKEITFLSADGKTNIHGYIWESSLRPKGIIVMSHGFSEHMHRHEDVADYFTKRGYHFAGMDHIGHGRSVWVGDEVLLSMGYNRKWSEGKDSNMLPGTMVLERGGFSYLVEDYAHFVKQLKALYKDIPIIIMGFSLGSVVVRSLLTKEPGIADKAVILSSSMWPVSILKVIQTMLFIAEKFEGKDRPSSFAYALFFKSYNMLFLTDHHKYAWFSSNHTERDGYDKDPMITDFITTGFVYEMLSGFIETSKGFEKMDQDTPCLLVAGKGDFMGNLGMYMRKLRKRLTKAGIPVRMRLFPRMRHDILHEPGREDVLLEIYRFLERKRKC